MASTLASDGKVSGLASGAHPTATFPCNHLSSAGQPTKAEVRPAPGATSFPNDHLAFARQESQDGGSVAPAAWARPEQRATAAGLRQAVKESDWSGLFADGKTSCQMQSSWSANDERCNALSAFCALLRARRVLEIGAFCGAASLSMAEVLPSDGEVVSLDYEAFPFQEVGREIKASSPHFSKIRFLPGAAKESLARLVAEEQQQMFDLAIIDADKAGMRAYFDLLCSTPGFLSDQATICVDVTAFKGTPPDRYVKFGQADRWEYDSGKEDIDAFRAFVQGSANFQTFELAGMLVVKRLV